LYEFCGSQKTSEIQNWDQQVTDGGGATANYDYDKQ